MSLAATYFTVLCALLGALGGSFVNVVIHRGPALWGLTDTPPHPGSRFNLAHPASHCPACQTRLAPFDLLPVISYLARRGRCRTCGARIARRYLIVEVLGLTLGIASALLLAPAAAMVLLCFSLIVLGAAAIDAETGYLPDALTLTALWLGLIASAAGLTGLPPSAAILGAAIGYGAFWLIDEGYRAVRGREGLGGGDAKLIAAGGALLGPLALPFAVLAAAVFGLVLAVLTGRLSAQAELRFGPPLAAGILGIALLDAGLPGRVVPPWPFS